MLISQKIKRNSRNEASNIIIPLVGQDSLSGDEQEANKFVSDTTKFVINPVVDGEKFIYKQKFDTSYTFQFFTPIIGGIYGNTLLNDGFDISEFNLRLPIVQNSFFIAQYYDSVDIDNQVLLHSSYLNGYQILLNSASTEYSSSFISNTELSEIFLSENFVNSKPNNTFNVYGRYYFFNSKTGQVTPFYAEENESLKTSEKLFYSFTVNKAQRNYVVNAGNPVVIKEINNFSYRSKITDRVDKLSLERQNPPAGEGFSPEGDYVELS